MLPKPIKPSLSDLNAWLHNNSTRWILERLNEQFRKWPASMPHKTLEEANSRAAEQRVLEAIYKLCE